MAPTGIATPKPAIAPASREAVTGRSCRPGPVPATAFARRERQVTAPALKVSQLFGEPLL